MAFSSQIVIVFWQPVIIIVNKKTNTTYNMKLKKVFDVYAVLVTALILRLIHSEKAVVFFFNNYDLTRKPRRVLL